MKKKILAMIVFTLSAVMSNAIAAREVHDEDYYIKLMKKSTAARDAAKEKQSVDLKSKSQKTTEKAASKDDEDDISKPVDTRVVDMNLGKLDPNRPCDFSKPKIGIPIPTSGDETILDGVKKQREFMKKPKPRLGCLLELSPNKISKMILH